MKLLLIYNLSSGRGSVTKNLGKIKTFFETNKFEYDIYDIRSQDQVTLDMLKLGPNYDCIVIAGGDGTIHSVINGVMGIPIQSRPRLLILPFGTTNDFAHMLGLGSDIDFNLALLKTNHFRKSDVYSLNNEFFVYAAAMGKFSNVSYDIDRNKLKKMGSFGYLLNARKDLFKRHIIGAKITTNALNLNRKVFLILVASGSRIGGFNIRKFSKSPKLNDGKVDIRIFTRNHIFSWMKIIWFYLFKGKHFFNDIHIHTDHIKIDVDGKYIWNVDGEAGPKGMIEVYTLKEQIEVYVNPKVIHKLF